MQGHGHECHFVRKNAIAREHYPASCLRHGIRVFWQILFRRNRQVDASKRRNGTARGHRASGLGQLKQSLD